MKKKKSEIVEEKDKLEKTEIAEEKNKSEKLDKVEIEKSSTESNNALFLQRLAAFFIDIFIITLISSFLTIPFYDTEVNTKLNNESNEIVQKYTAGEIDINTYTTEFMNIAYQLARNNGLASLITIVLEVLYFVVYQFYAKGQTVGKRLLKIKTVSIDGELSMNQLIFRALIINSILLNLIDFSFMLFGSKQIYFYCVGIFEMIQYLVVIVSALMIMYSKSSRGIHDLVTHTKVVKV